MSAAVSQARMMGRLSFGGAGPSSLKVAKKSIPGLRSGISLFEHQDEAVQKLIAKDGNLLFSHPVGSGKTLSSIAAFEALRDAGKAERALVVTPASLRTNYLDNGVKRFTDAKGVIFGTSEEVKNGAAVSTEKPDKDARYHIVSYDLFRKDPKKYIDAAGADTVIYDELHKAKNEGVLTTKAIKEARPFHRNFIGMTGSIVSNTPADIVPLVDAMTNGKHVLGNKTTFEARFVKTHDDGKKTLNHPMVLRTLLAPYIHHVDAESLNTSAPKKNVEEVHVEMSPHQTQLYKYITKDLDWLTQKKLEFGISKLNNAELNDMFAKLVRLRQVSNAVHTMDNRVTVEQSAKETPKVKKLLDDVEEHLNETKDGQVVIHTNLIRGGVDVLTAGLKDRGIDHALFIGKGQPGVTEKTRQHGVKEYQQGKKKVIVLSAAGGEGLDLPNTTMMAMLDGHFNPEKINQAEARGIRAGGLSHRAPSDRKVIVRRYMSVFPSDTSRKLEVLGNIAANMNPGQILSRLQAGGPAFFNPLKKPKTTDEFIYDVASRKGELNKALYETVKKGSVPYTTHEQWEEVFEIEKVAGKGDEFANGIIRGINVAFKHPELAGAVVGAGVGALLGGTPPRSKRVAEQDPNAPSRNRLSSMLGGAAGGALGGHILAKGTTTPQQRLLSAWGATSSGASAGRAIGELFAPRTAVPTTVSDVLGDRQRYSDKHLFEKYWDEFGPELERKGIESGVHNKAREEQFMAALRDLYSEARANNAKGEPPKKKNFLIGSLLGMSLVPALTHGKNYVLAKAFSAAAGEPLPTPSFQSSLLESVPALTGALASQAKEYREHYLDPGVTVQNKTEAKARAKFDDEQLRRLLRGLGVEEVKVKQHVIK